MDRRAALHLRYLLISLVVAGAHGGCSYIRTTATGGLVEDVSLAALKHDDVDLVLQGMPTYLLLLEGLIEGDRKNAELLRQAAEAYTGYATLIEAAESQRAAALLTHAREYGMAALVARRPAVARLVAGPFSEFEDIDRHLHKADLPYVFWAASSWGAWIGANLNSIAALADLPRVIHLMRWVIERDEHFRHGAPHVFLGVYHAALPPVLGGEPERSLFHFERALEITDGQDHMVRIQMARFYARQIFDRELYVELLEQVLSSPADGVAEFTLQNNAAKRLAETMLQDVDVYF